MRLFSWEHSENNAALTSIWLDHSISSIVRICLGKSIIILLYYYTNRNLLNQIWYCIIICCQYSITYHPKKAQEIPTLIQLFCKTGAHHLCNYFCCVSCIWQSTAWGFVLQKTSATNLSILNVGTSILLTLLFYCAYTVKLQNSWTICKDNYRFQWNEKYVAEFQWLKSEQLKIQ